jgi:hypothetical protein
MGIITFGMLKKYIGEKMTEEGKQTPISSLIETGPFLDTPVATMEDVLSKKMQTIITEIRGLIGEENKDNTLPNVWSLDTAVNKLVNLSKVNPNAAKEISQLEEAINKRLVRYNKALSAWLNDRNNEQIAGPEIEKKVSQGLWDTFQNIVFNLNDYKHFQQLSELDKRYLNRLRPDLEVRRQYTSADDDNLVRLIVRLTSARQTHDMSRHQGG